METNRLSCETHQPHLYIHVNYKTQPKNRQIAAADVLLLNKSDLATESDLVRIEYTLHHLNPSIPIFRTVRTQIDLSKVMGIGAYSERSQAFLDIESPLNPREGHEDCSDHDHAHEHEGQLSSDNRHAGISSIIAIIPGPMSDSQITSLDEWIRGVLWENIIPRGQESDELETLRPQIQRLSIDQSNSHYTNGLRPDLEILRCKGVWWNERGEQFMLQGVRSLYEVSKLQSTVAELDGPLMGKLVFIGKGLNQAVEDSLRRLVT